MIDLAAYYMGRDGVYASLLTPELQANAAETVKRAAEWLQAAKAAGVTLEENPRTGTVVSSGWRPPAINASTKGAAIRSKHMTCQALDVFDPDGDLDEWCMSPQGQRCMADLGLWHEHPSATKGWCHVQTVPPRSGRRTFYP